MKIEKLPIPSSLLFRPLIMVLKIGDVPGPEMTFNTIKKKYSKLIFRSFPQKSLYSKLILVFHSGNFIMTFWETNGKLAVFLILVIL